MRPESPRHLRADGEPLTTAEGGDLPPGAVLNMELSLLAFNRRVLALAEDPLVPLLERVRLVSIFGANLDEFFRVRVAGFKRQLAEGSTKRTLDGVTPAEQLRAIEVRTRRLLDAAYRLLLDTLRPELDRHGVRVVRHRELRERDRAFLWEYYRDRVHAALTPLAIGRRAPCLTCGPTPGTARGVAPAGRRAERAEALLRAGGAGNPPSPGSAPRWTPLRVAGRGAATWRPPPRP